MLVLSRKKERRSRDENLTNQETYVAFPLINTTEGRLPYKKVSYANMFRNCPTSYSSISALSHLLGKEIIHGQEAGV